MLAHMRSRLIKATALILALTVQPGWAAEITRIEVRGLDDEMTANVREVISLEDARDKEISERRLDYLVGVAEAETREALEPFGYYNPVIKVSTTGSRLGALACTTSSNHGSCTCSTSL